MMNKKEIVPKTEKEYLEQTIELNERMIVNLQGTNEWLKERLENL